MPAPQRGATSLGYAAGTHACLWSECGADVTGAGDWAGDAAAPPPSGPSAAVSRRWEGEADEGHWCVSV